MIQPFRLFYDHWNSALSSKQWAVQLSHIYGKSVPDNGGLSWVLPHFVCAHPTAPLRRRINFALLQMMPTQDHKWFLSWEMIHIDAKLANENSPQEKNSWRYVFILCITQYMCQVMGQFCVAVHYFCLEGCSLFVLQNKLQDLMEAENKLKNDSNANQGSEVWHKSSEKIKDSYCLPWGC